MIFKISKEITNKDILELVPEENLYSFYFEQNIKPNKLYNCCFHEDKTPSLGFYKSSTGKQLLYKCFSCGATGNIFEFVKQKFNLNYRESVNKIKEDFFRKDIGINTFSNKKTQYEILPTYKKTEIYPKFRNWLKIDFDYWNQYHIPLELLIKYDINPCSTVYVKNNKGYYQYALHKNNNPIYHYNVDGSSKIYRPLSTNKKGKWLQNCSNFDIQGLKQIPFNNDLLFITSSLKDILVLNLLGYAAIAPHGEGVLIPDKIMDYLFATNKEIILWYDNDEVGLTYSKQHSKYYGINYILIPNEYKEKDPSDFVKEYGLDNLNLLINSII